MTPHHETLRPRGLLRPVPGLLCLMALSALLANGCASRAVLTPDSDDTPQADPVRDERSADAELDALLAELDQSAPDAALITRAQRLALRLQSALRFELTTQGASAIERAGQWRRLQDALQRHDIALSEGFAACRDGLDEELSSANASRCAQAGLGELVELEALRRTLLALERWSSTGRAPSGVFEALECGPAGIGAFREGASYAGDDELAALRSRDEALCLFTATARLASELEDRLQDTGSAPFLHDLEARAMEWLAQHPVPVELLQLRGDDDISLMPAQASFPSLRAALPRFHAGQLVLLARSRGVALGAMPQWSDRGYRAPDYEERFTALGYGLTLEQTMALRETLEGLAEGGDDLLIVIDASLRWRQLSGVLQQLAATGLSTSFVFHDREGDEPRTLRLRALRESDETCSAHLSIRADGLLAVFADGTLNPIPWALNDQRSETRAAMETLLDACPDVVELRVEDEMTDWGLIVRTIEALAETALVQDLEVPMVNLIVGR